MRISLNDIIALPHVERIRFEMLEGRSFNGISTDSRTIEKGNLFFALRGENYDGHMFVDAACHRGALLAVVDRSGLEKVKTGIPLIVVPDTTVALGVFAFQYRSKFSIPVIGVAGSNGKTTTKDMIAAVLRQQFQVVSTEGNLNNHIGVPLTLLRLDRKTEMAVIELGTNHPGELGRLCAIARPTAGVITNIGHEHLEFFGSLDGVEQEESTLLDTLADTPRATAFINVDDERIVRHTPVKGRSVTYGFTAPADFRGTIVSRSPQGAAVMKIAGGTLQKPVQISLGIPGDHIAIDALAAAAVGLTYRVPAGKIRSALEEFRPASKRMEVFTLNGVTILNDAYNANPDSMLAALRTLSSISTKGKRIAVLGDMRELGDHAAEEHSRIGREISTLHIDYILTCGASAKNIAGAVTGTFAAHYEQKSILAEFLAELIGPGDIVLIKASRGMRFEDILTFIEERLKARMILDASTGEAQEDKGETPAQ